MMWAGSLSHNGLTGCGSDGGDWACHGLEHEIGGMFDVTHGAGLAAPVLMVGILINLQKIRLCQHFGGPLFTSAGDVKHVGHGLQLPGWPPCGAAGPDMSTGTACPGSSGSP